MNSFPLFKWQNIENSVVPQNLQTRLPDLTSVCTVYNTQSSDMHGSLYLYTVYSSKSCNYGSQDVNQAIWQTNIQHLKKPTLMTHSAHND